jgi:acyl-CoA dehydrogenase
MSPTAEDYSKRLTDFMSSQVYPNEQTYRAQREELGAAGRPHDLPPIVEELKFEARARGLWNLFLRDVSGMSNVDYAHLAEISGRSVHLAPEAMNCDAPDTGNMEVLNLFGTAEQKERWLQPLLDGEIRSAFAMTEPKVASSDATNISTEIRRDGSDYVINGRKWWITGAADPRCAVMIVMGKTRATAPRHTQQSMVLVPMDTPGVTVMRALSVFGYRDQHGHCEIDFYDVRVPASNLISDEGAGLAIAQSRLGPGRIHHCMRAVGMAERALELACKRAASRSAFGAPIAQQGVVQAQIAEARMAIEQARLMTLKAAWLIDTVGVKGAHSEVAAIKVIAPRMLCSVVDAAIQIHGGGGVSDDFPLAEMYAIARTLRIIDGPDEVHVRSVARQELGKYQASAGRPPTATVVVDDAISNLVLHQRVRAEALDSARRLEVRYRDLSQDPASADILAPLAAQILASYGHVESCATAELDRVLAGGWSEMSSAYLDAAGAIRIATDAIDWWGRLTRSHGLEESPTTISADSR